MIDKLLGDYLDEILKNINIVDIIGKTVDLKKIENGYTGECPFCKEQVLYVSKSQQIYHCSNCGEKGNAITFIDNIIINRDKNSIEKISKKQYFKKSFEILREFFPKCTEEQYREIFVVIQSLLHTKVMRLTKNKSYISYRDNGRFLKEFRFICEFIKSEQDTEEDKF